MKKTTIRLFRNLFLICSLFPSISRAQPSPPRLINLQAVLVDEGGNVLYNQQEADIIFSIVDGAGETFYEEEQHVVLVNGAISVLVGQGVDLSTGGATGGIPLEALEPEGTKLLRVKLKDQSIPQEDLELATVPYAMYADKAYSLVEPLDSSGILDGTIQQIDLSTELIAYIDDRAGGASEDQLAQHRQEDGAHTASSISVVNTFINASGNNVQQILIGLDRAIGTRRNQEGVLGEEIDTEATDRTAADAAETAAREAAVLAEEAERAAEDVRVLESEISRAGDAIYGDLTFYTDETLSTQTMSIAPSSGNISSQGELSLLDGLVSINRDASTSDPVLSIDDTDGVERLRLDGDTGLMTIQGNVSITGTVDGVDVSVEQTARIDTDNELRGDLNAHTGASSAHGSNGNVVGQNTLDSAISGHYSTAIDLAHPNGNFPTSRLSGAIQTSQMASQNISQWNNDSSYISDGNTNWDNNYGYITDGNSGWDNSYGFITAAAIPSYNFTGWDTDASNDLTSADAASIADGQITEAINNNTIPNTAAEVGAAEAGHTHDYSASGHSHGGIISNYQIISEHCSPPIGRGHPNCTVNCPAGTQVVGGGCQVPDFSYDLTANHPAGNGWYCRGSYVGSSTINPTTYAICLGWE